MLKFHCKKIYSSLHVSFFGMAIGAFLAAVAIRIFLVPNQLIDGGIVGISLILARLYGDTYLSYFLILLNFPFIYLAYTLHPSLFVIHMLVAIVAFCGLSLMLLEHAPSFHADPLEVIVIGGAMLGVGVGLIIRHGGCTDGTEILAILINRKKGFTVGQVDPLHQHLYLWRLWLDFSRLAHRPPLADDLYRRFQNDGHRDRRSR